MKFSKIFLVCSALAATSALASGDNEPASSILPGSTLEFTSQFIIPVPTAEQFWGEVQIINIGTDGNFLCRFQLAKELSPTTKPVYIDAGATRTVNNVRTQQPGVILKGHKETFYGNRKLFSKDYRSTGNEWVEFRLRADGKFSLFCYDTSHDDKAWNRSMPTIGNVRDALKTAGISLQLNAKATEDMAPANF